MYRVNWPMTGHGRKGTKCYVSTKEHATNPRDEGRGVQEEVADLRPDFTGRSRNLPGRQEA